MIGEAPMNRFLILALPFVVLVSCQGEAGSTKTVSAPPKTVISSARVQGSSLIIAGTYFASGTTVTLGGSTLKVSAAKPQELTVPLPESLAPGTYLLTVGAGTPGTSDSFIATIGAAGPPGPSGPPGSSATFPAGYSILGESPVPPKGFTYSGYSVISQGG